MPSSPVELHVDDQPRKHQEWMADQDLEGRQKRRWNFHRWMRQESSIDDSGTIMEYTKKVFQLMDEDGTLDVDYEELGTREKTAYNKFQEYLDDVDKPVSCDAEGDRSE